MSKNKNEEIYPEKLIIIGVVGPVGSGCTTISKFLTDKPYEDIEGIQSYLQKNNFLSNNQVNFEKYEDEVKSLYRTRLETDEEIATLSSNLSKSRSQKDYEKLQSLKYEGERLHWQTKKILEDREVITSLDFLADNQDYKKEARYYISVSDLIILKCLVELETETNSKDNKMKIDKIKEITNDKLRTSNTSHKEFKQLYQSIQDFFCHRGKEKPTFEHFSKCFEQVRYIKGEIAKLDFYREIMQDFGDNIRSTGNPFRYLECYPDEFERYDLIRRNKMSLAKDLDFIIHYLMNNEFYFLVVDCFRNPNTAEYFRQKYSKFYLISLFSTPEQRRERLISKESKRQEFSFDRDRFIRKFESIYDKRDKGEDLTLIERLYRQNVTDTCLISDIAINNDETKEILLSKMIRYLGLILDPGCTKPTADEMFMNLAYTMAMKSNCISRQAGAVIVGKEGYVIGAGWNDVGDGQISCGLRNIRDLSLPVFEPYVKALSSEERKIIEVLIEKWKRSHFCFCFKDEMSSKKILGELEAIEKDFLKSRPGKLGKKDEELRQEIFKRIKQDLSIKRLEYCKALHAEENAIIQGAKIGGMGIMGSKMYATSFPCELCAKKIQQSRIEEVVYTEPYPTDISKEVYLEDGVSKVISRQFEGVKPFGYFRLFKPFPDQKEWQELNKLEIVD